MCRTYSALNQRVTGSRGVARALPRALLCRAFSPPEAPTARHTLAWGNDPGGSSLFSVAWKSQGVAGSWSLPAVK